MKSFISIGLTVMLFTAALPAQRANRVGYIDMDYILKNVPQYQLASELLDQKAGEWKIEIEQEKERIEDLKRELDRERPLLTQKLIEDREDEIKFEEQQLRAYQQKRFGPQGDLIQQQLNLVRPVQDQVFNAVQEIAEARNYDFIFDKSSEPITLYAEEQHDLSDMVLRRIELASNRREVSNRQQREALRQEEERSPEQSAEVQKREDLRNQRVRDREALLEERRRMRDSIREARQRAFQERREEILRQRQQKRDSVERAREQDQ